MEIIQENMLAIGVGALLIFVLFVFFMLRKRIKNKGEKAESIVPSKESMEPLHEEESSVAVDESEESDFEPEKLLFEFISVAKGNRFFVLNLKALESDTRITEVSPSKNSYGEFYNIDGLSSKRFHPRKPLSIHFDYNKRGVKSESFQFETSFRCQDSEGRSWIQKFIFDKSGDSRILKPRAA